jgi:energy-coupling factor transport system ATP-binding protein
MSVLPGERLLLLGPSGSGKSTLLLTLTGLIPQTVFADVAGTVTLFGHEVGARHPAQWASAVAQLFQNPEQMLCGMTVADEVAFALENQGRSVLDIHRRVNAALDGVGFAWEQRTRRTMTLSGGEKQLAAFAAVLAQDAPLLVIDEPTAHLAPAAASRLRRLLMAGTPATRSIILVDHRLDGMLALIDRVVALDATGKIVGDGEPRGFFRRNRQRLVEAGIWVPLAAELDAALAAAGIELDPPPLTMKEAIDELAAQPRQLALACDVARSFAAGHCAAAPASAIRDDAVAVLSDVHCAPPFGPVILRVASLALHRGERLAILGRNGAGKTTLAATLAGVLRPRQGRRTGALGGLCLQNPECQFLTGSVRDELLAALQGGGGNADRLLDDWGLAGLGDRHPLELSQGQKRRLALATVMAGAARPLLVLDEPTAGLDAAGQAVLRQRLAALAEQGHAIAVVTHDLDFALRTCPRAVIVGEGRILADGPTAEMLSDPALLARADLEEPSVIALRRWLDRRPC